MWGGLDGALGVSVKPKAPPPASTPANEGTAVPEPPRRREPFNLFGGLAFFGGLDGALGVSVAKPRMEDAADRPRPPPVPLRSTYTPGRVENDAHETKDRLPPLVVLVHGLESHGGTWDDLVARFVASERSSPSFLAVDLRGHGLSPVGDEASFTPGALAADVAACVEAHNREGRKVVLVGHSMGGRVAARLCADFPGVVSRLVIEDMDARVFDGTKYFGEQWGMTGFDYERARAFKRTDDSLQAMTASLTHAAGVGTFTKDRVDGYVVRGRVFESTNGGRAVSLIQPLGFCLAFDRVLACDDMQDALSRIASMPLSSQPEIHLWRAPEKCGESCASLAPGVAGGVEWIQSKFSERRVHDCVFPGAGHSVHKDTIELFERALRELAFHGTPAAFEREAS